MSFFCLKQKYIIIEIHVFISMAGIQCDGVGDSDHSNWENMDIDGQVLELMEQGETGFLIRILQFEKL